MIWNAKAPGRNMDALHFDLPEDTISAAWASSGKHPALRRGNALYELGLYRLAGGI
jgi:hypothetical protein